MNVAFSCCYAECYDAESCLFLVVIQTAAFFIVILSVEMLSVIMLSVAFLLLC
jgi:hypothetical protein